MALLLTSTRRLSQPRQPVGIDWSHPLARRRRLVGVLNVGALSWHQPSKTTRASPSLKTQFAAKNGLALRHEAFFSYAIAGVDEPALAGYSGPTTMLSVVVPGTTTTENGVSVMGGGFGHELRSAYGGTAGRVGASFRGAGAIGSTTVLSDLNAPAVIVSRNLPGVEQSLWLNGVKEPTTTALSSDPLTAAGMATSSTARSGLMYSLWWMSGLLDDEVEEISAAPWQLHLPLQRRIWVAASSAIAFDLVIEDAHQGHAAGNAGLSLSTVLATAGATHAHTADSLALSTVAQTDLVVASAAHLQAAGSPVLTVDSALATQDAQHAQLTDHVTLGDSSAVSLATGSASHGHTAQSVGLTADSTLAVANAAHAHAADSVTLGTTGAVNLGIASAAHAHQAGALTLTSASVLAVQSASHAHVSDAVLLSVALNLAVASTTHAHGADSLDLSGVPSLQIASAHHAQVAGLVVLNTLSWLQVADAWHAQVADHLVLQYSGQLTRAPLGGGYRRGRVDTMRPITGNTARPRR